MYEFQKPTFARAPALGILFLFAHQERAGWTTRKALGDRLRAIRAPGGAVLLDVPPAGPEHFRRRIGAVWRAVSNASPEHPALAVAPITFDSDGVRDF